MNKQRRKKLEDAIEILTSQLHQIEIIKEEEQEAYENLPESIQCSKKGESMEENVDSLDSIYSDLENVIDSIQELIEE